MCAAPGSVVLLESQLDAHFVFLDRCFGRAANNEYPRWVDVSADEQDVLDRTGSMLSEHFEFVVLDRRLLHQRSFELSICSTEVRRRLIFLLASTFDRLRESGEGCALAEVGSVKSNQQLVALRRVG